MEKNETIADLTSNCTSILVGRKMSKDGSFMAGRSEDWDSQFAKHFEFYEDTDNGSTEFIAEDSPFRCPLPQKAYGYTALAPYHLSNHWGSAGFNTQGVGMSATETIFSNEKALQADPLVESGMGENCIYNVVIPYIKTAREGVLRLGEMIEQYGSSEGYGVSFVDAHEMWYLETAAGHRWMATRIPEDVYFVSGNQSRFREYHPEDTANYLGSKDLIEFAIQHDLYRPAEGNFDFHTAYAREDSKVDPTYNYPRVWYLQSLFNPEIQNDVTKNTFPVFSTANRQLALDDVKSAFRSHYNGTEHDPYLHQNPKEPFRPISIYRTTQTHILHVRPELPQAIGCINYIALGMAALTAFLPYYQGIHSLPESYQKGDNEFSDDSIYWQFKKVQALAMVNYNQYAPIVQEAYNRFEAELAKRQEQMEKEFVALHSKDATKAQKLIQDFSDKMVADVTVLNQRLINQLFTQLGKDIQAVYLFHGA